MSAEGHSRARRHASPSFSALDGLAALVLLLLAWAPFPLGANRPLPAAILAVLVGVLLVLWCLVALVRRPLVRLDASVVVAGLAVMAVIGWTYVQAAPWTPESWHAPVWAILQGTGIEGAARISIDAWAPIDAIIGLATPAGMFLLCYLLGQRARRARFLLRGLLAISAGYALLGLYMALSGWRPWDELIVGGRLVTSTIVNRNHFATYANLGLCIALALLLAKGSRAESEQVGWRAMLARAVVAPLERAPLVAASAGVLLVAILGSQSRGGFLALAGALAATLYARVAGRAFTARQAALGLVVALASAVAIVALAGGPLLERFDQVMHEAEDDAGSRLSGWRRTVELIGLTPYLGSGNGTYLELFMMNNDARFTGVFDHAHNDYLEAAVELGLPAAALLVGALALLWLRCAHQAWVARRTRQAGALAATLGGVVVGLHALVDFSLVIPAVAVQAAALLGLGCARAVESGAGAGAGRPAEAKPSSGAPDDEIMVSTSLGS